MKSDYFGSEFQEISKNLVCDKNSNYCDFVPIKSLDGVILINLYDSVYIDVIGD